MKTAERRENPRQIDTYQELGQAHRDIKNAVDAGLFMGGLNILLLLMLIFNPALAAKTNWVSIFFIAIGLPIIFGCVVGICRHSLRAAKIIHIYLSVHIILGIFGVISTPGELLVLTFIPFLPYLLYGFYKGVCGTRTLKHLDLNQSLDIVVDHSLEDGAESFHKIKLQQQLIRARNNIDIAVRSGLLMGGIIFILNVAYYSEMDASRAQIDMTPIIILMDALIIFGCTYRIHENSSSASLWMLGYSIFSLMMKVPPTAYDKISDRKFATLDRFEILIIIALLLSSYLFCGFYKGIIGISTLNRLTQMQVAFHQLWKDSGYNRWDANARNFFQIESPYLFATANHTAIMLEVERQYRWKQAHKDIKIAIVAGLVIGGIQVLSCLFISTNPVLIAKMDLIKFVTDTINIISIFGCTYGISRHSQIAAKMMMLYFAINLVIDICTQNFSYLNIALMCYLFYGAYKGMVGTSALKQYQ